MAERLEQVWAAIDPQRLKQTLLEMIDIYSPSGKEEDIQLYLEGVLAQAGIHVVRQEVEEERYNLLATMGPEQPPLCFVGHVDTVAAWDIDDYAAKDEWGVVRGLGSADMKGGCAAMVEAWLALATLPEDRRPNIGLLLCVGEEENGDGSTRFLEEQQPEWVVIGEPTSMQPAFSHYGYLEMELQTRGRRTHSSLPELGHNAIESMLRVLLELDRSAIFKRQPGKLVYSIREMSSSRAGFVVPDSCEAMIDLHLAPDVRPAEVRSELEVILEKARQRIDELDLEVSFAYEADGYQLEQSGWLLEIFEEVYPRLNLPLTLLPFRSHSDGNLFYQAGCKPLVLGPGSLETAHTAEEQTSLAEVEAAARIYCAIALGLPTS
ncbi:acetylornithine deacetylase [Malonomonas rubra DSM 5091]|uniref:Acetylornithine deacetylase n=1 Tax=Malonomonas rubra DSM 5091 TaxID=1122189 RepID=A0A1M6MLW7_MALRU|nr:M20/M25/M40 family metallo-hydrolase [Malonomonas rubra]SHJ84468.1 acetylornithine deacetylase [Malonomonas rubra DSM 5091]